MRAVDAGAFPQALALKSQITGPMTLAGLLGADGRGRLRPKLIDTLAEHVARRAVHQARRLLTLGLPVLIFADEPALVLTDPQQIIRAQALLNGIFGRIRLVGARTGLHCCATTRPAWLTSFACDVVSFDASQVAPPNEDDISVMGDPQRILAFGLIRARQEPEQAGSAFTRWLTAASIVGDPPALAARTIVTSRCGLGRCTFAEAEVTFRAVGEVAALVSACAGVVRSTDTGAQRGETAGSSAGCSWPIGGERRRNVVPKRLKP